MIRIYDEAPRRDFPLTTLSLVALNTLVFLHELDLGAGLQSSISAWGSTPAAIATGRAAVSGGPDPVYLTLLTSMFLHGGWLHLLSNMLFLWVLGNIIEPLIGSSRFLLFYLLGGISAALAHVFANHASELPDIGASGAVAALLGGYLVMRVTRSLQWLPSSAPPVRIAPVLLMVGLWALLQIVTALASSELGSEQAGGAAYWSHLGGFATGLLTISLFRRRRRYRRFPRFP